MLSIAKEMSLTEDDLCADNYSVKASAARSATAYFAHYHAGYYLKDIAILLEKHPVSLSRHMHIMERTHQQKEKKGDFSSNCVSMVFGSNGLIKPDILVTLFINARLRKLMKLAIGIDDFKKVIEEDYLFVDKSLFIKDILDDSSEVILITRPRRFGKTLNMSMLKYYLDIREDYSPLFPGLLIDQHQEEYHQHRNAHPVIFLSLKRVKLEGFEKNYAAIQSLIKDLYLEHKYLLKSNHLEPSEKKVYQQLIDREASEVDLQDALAKLSVFLHRHHGMKAVILIDEYDTPIQAGYLNNHMDEMVTFMRAFLGNALKGNLSLEKAVLTGILRVSKENLFSGLNNIEVYTVLRREYGQYFGFTEPEVNDLLRDADLSEHAENIKGWYNGYNIGGKTIYNPWSLINCLKQKGLTKPYWVNTSDNALINEQLRRSTADRKLKVEQLLNQGSLDVEINENVVFGDLRKNEQSLWSLLLLSGYLTADNVNWTAELATCNVRLPNKEIAGLFNLMVKDWFTAAIDTNAYETFLESLVNGDLERFKNLLTSYVLETTSYFDLTDNTPEQVYHMFILGMLVGLRGRYQVHSNRETGLGRSDVILMPHDKNENGIVIEFKSINKDSDQAAIDKEMQTALKQIQTHEYHTTLQQAGIKNILCYGIVFAGKRVAIEVTKS